METTKVLYRAFLLLFGALHWGSGSENLRILGGENTMIEDHPWDVSFQMKGHHFCGGAIIAPELILTAAHCFYVRDLKKPVYDVVAGVTDLNHTEFGQRVKPAYIIFHENYNNNTYDNDIAIVQLKEPLQFNSRVTKIGLPKPFESLPINTALTISGWGIIERGTHKLLSNLQMATIYTVDRSHCADVLSKYNAFTERMFCAGVLTGAQDTCQGDSGGGVELNGIAYGVVSWGAGCGKAGLPGAYTKVSHFRKWIQEIAGV